MASMRVLAVFILIWAVSGCVTAPDPAPAAAPKGTYKLDPAHASLILRLGHGKGLSQFTARFDDFDAALEFDAAHPQNSRLSVVIETASISTGMTAFDEKLARTKNLLDAKAHPQIRFQSSNITKTGPQSGEVTGDLTLRGITHPITLLVHYNGRAYDPLRGGQVAGFSADGTFSRGQFGADAWSNFGVGDTISVHIEAEFIKT